MIDLLRNGGETKEDLGRTNRTDRDDVAQFGNTFGTSAKLSSQLSSQEGPQIAENVTDSENFITFNREQTSNLIHQVQNTRDYTFDGSPPQPGPLRESAPESSNKDSFARPGNTFQHPQPV